MQPAQDVLTRVFGSSILSIITLNLQPNSQKDCFTILQTSQHISITANTPIALCRGAYHALKSTLTCISTWLATIIHLPKQFESYSTTIESPFELHYYMNVVTHGYSAPYWGWDRWEKEIDWMALHGINMPLIPGAHEAILHRVFLSLGLTKLESMEYFTGPAHFPWNRMGNITGVDGPVPDSYFSQQIALTHKILNRMRELGMHPIIQAFAGFVPKSINKHFPDELRDIIWLSQFPDKNHSHLLSPKSALFTRIGKDYIIEWEKEFGNNTYYLADSFNEMTVPISSDPQIALKELSEYGTAVYQPIKEANPKAVWVLQGWTFGYKRDFWTPERFNALLSNVPNDNVLILDLANEYNAYKWKIDPFWKLYNGFFGKKWIFSYIPNMGGNSPFSGQLCCYPEIIINALKYTNKGNMVGYGFAPEGIENNEMIYELLSDIGWSSEQIDINKWYNSYCTQRYGADNKEFSESLNYMKASCYYFTAHPIFMYQLNPYNLQSAKFKERKLPNIDEQSVALFLSSYSKCKSSCLYLFDAIEMICQYMQCKVDKCLTKYTNSIHLPTKKKAFQKAMTILGEVDELYRHHPHFNLQQWVDYARKWGKSEAESNYYEANAKKLITVWEVQQLSDYAAKTWSQLIRSYYIQRWVMFDKGMSKDCIINWEKQWVETPIKRDESQMQDPWELIAHACIRMKLKVTFN